MGENGGNDGRISGASRDDRGGQDGSQGREDCGTRPFEGCADGDWLRAEDGGCDECEAFGVCVEGLEMLRLGSRYE